MNRLLGRWWIIIIVALVFSLYAYAVWQGYFKEGIELSDKLAKFGDSFGVLNTLFSGLAFGGLLVTIFYQRDDLSLTRNEIEETRREVKQQNITNTLFQMLRLHQEGLVGIDLKRSVRHVQIEINGRDCFKVFSKRIRCGYNKALANSIFQGEEALIESACEYLWSRSRGDLGYYFRGLYSVCRYISESDFSDKKELGRIVRAQISDYELVVIFYNCLSERGKKFTKYASEFCLFDNIDISLLIHRDHVRMMDVDAFGSNEEALALCCDLNS